MTENNSTKPCLVQTSQGFSIQYNQRLLYSKYNPAKTILSLVQSTEILPGTVILCFSPVLSYGIQELADKLPEECLMLGVEKEPALLNYAENTSAELECKKTGNYRIIPLNKIYSLPEYITQINDGRYKRCIKLDFSGGVQFHKEFYDQLFAASQDSVAQFWKNRVTLVKFGRKYASNTLRNIQQLQKSCSFVKTSKPVLVIGAGESALDTLKQLLSSDTRNNFFILAVDAALQTLKSLKIHPDGVVCEEAQDIITRAFTGCKDYYKYLFVSTSSNKTVTRISPEKNIFYTTKYCNCGFLENLISKGILQNVIPPLGSVGLSAMELALKIRIDDSVPVIITGMDFSYSAGQTHLLNSFHEKNRRIASSKIKSINSFGSSFSKEIKRIEGKNKILVFTSPVLENYAKLFAYKYSDAKNIYDMGKTGIFLNIPQIQSFSELILNNQDAEKTENNNFEALCIKNEKISKFIQEEKKALETLKDIFTGKTDLAENEKEQKILELLKNREYLYLHFPDGYKIQLSQSFLNRIRIEIDNFLKILGYVRE